MCHLVPFKIESVLLPAWEGGSADSLVRDAVWGEVGQFFYTLLCWKGFLFKKFTKFAKASELKTDNDAITLLKSYIRDSHLPQFCWNIFCFFAFIFL